MSLAIASSTLISAFAYAKPLDSGRLRPKGSLIKNEQTLSNQEQIDRPVERQGQMSSEQRYCPVFTTSDSKVIVQIQPSNLLQEGVANDFENAVFPESFPLAIVSSSDVCPYFYTTIRPSNNEQWHSAISVPDYSPAAMQNEVIGVTLFPANRQIMVNPLMQVESLTLYQINSGDPLQINSSTSEEPVLEI